MKPAHRLLTTLLALLLVAFSVSAFAQNDNDCQTIEGVKGTSVSVDPNGNVYVIDGSTLYKLTQNGSEWVKSQYSNFQLGDIASIDVDNPLKIMLFYQDEGMILFLDEKMNPLMEPLNLMDAGMNNISLATYSTDNTIWLYDVVLHDLINVNFKLKELSRNHLSIEYGEPDQLISLQEKQLALAYSIKGVAYYDAFGTYLETISVPVHYGLDWQLDNSLIYYVKYDDMGRTPGVYVVCYNYLLHTQQYLGEISCPVVDFAYSNGIVWGIDEEHHLKKIILETEE
jgi:hypothetical protein